MNNIESFIQAAVQAARQASEAILQVYESGDFDVAQKGDQSPLTRADREAHQVIAAALAPTGLPLLSEEGRAIAYAERKRWSRFWLVDPLDGTKEFLKRNGDFTVNIALIEGQRPVWGVVAVPVTGDLYQGGPGRGASVQRNGTSLPLPQRTRVDLQQPGLRVVASRSHQTPETEAFVQGLQSPALVSRGSSLKFMMVAEGLADVYPRYAPTMEWDTAAAHAIVNGVGLRVWQHDTEAELVYNKEDLLNPWFLVR